MMEHIVTLFEDFRENRLSYDDLYSVLLSKIQQDPSFRHQAIPTLDHVQQSTPIPITHFIQLRSELNSAVNNFRPSEAQQTSSASTDPDATLITPLPDEDATAPNLSVTTHDITQNKTGASDPTLMAASTGTAGDNPVDTVDTTVNTTSDDLDDEATMIMPSGTLSTPILSSEDETVINHDTEITTNTPPLAETLVGQSYEQNDEKSDEQPSNKNQVEAETLVGTHTGSAASIAAESTPTPTVWVWAGASTLIITCIIIFTFTSGIFETTRNTEVVLPEPTKPSNDESWGGAPEILQVETVSETVKKPSTPDTSNAIETTDEAAITTLARPTDNFPTTVVTTTPLDSSNTESQAKEPEQETVAAVAPVIEERVFQSIEQEVAYFVGRINNAKNANNLAPAEKVGTATYYLVKLIKASPNSPFVSRARSQIAKAHLALAATARDGERWDEAQQHLDDAFTVRLPDSYQSN